MGKLPHTLAGLASLLFIALPALAADAERKAEDMKIRIDLGEASVIAILQDTATGRDFASLLPLTLALEDYASTEKVADLPRKLVIEGAPAGTDPTVGDVTYYAPWGNLAIFYRDFGYAKGLVKLGTVESGLAALEKAGPGEVTITLLRE